MFHRSSSSSRRISAFVCRRFLVDVGKIRHSRPIFLQRPQGSCGTLCCSTSHRICKVSQSNIPSSQLIWLLFWVEIYLLLPTLDTCFPSWRCHVCLIHLVRSTQFASHSATLSRVLVGEKRHIRVYKKGNFAMSRRTRIAVSTLRRHQGLSRRCESDGGGMGPSKGPKVIFSLLLSQRFFQLCSLASRTVLIVSLNNLQS
jgi:hypothetical protein